MKSKVINVREKSICYCILGLTFLSLIFCICIDQVEDVSFEQQQIIRKAKIIQTNLQEENTLQVSDNITTSFKEYENFIKEYKGYKVVGKILIPKLEIEKYILEETSEDSLKVAVTKVCGPKVNGIGNFCISGHNYVQTFGRIKELEIGDEIILTDTYNREIKYQVYKSYKVYPNDISCLKQETNGEREVTLITCTLGAIKRNIVKAVEVYD